MAATAPIQLDRERIRELTEREEARLNERTRGSKAMYERADRVLSNGVASSYQLREPWPIYLEHGAGPTVWDVDGNRMWDFHNGFGSMVQGHAHPAIGRAVTARYELGTHFAAPTEDAVVVGEELERRFGLQRWRYTNSGSESTMDAIRIARAYTKRDTVMKIFGSYHGHHDTVMVSIGVEYDRIGPHDAPASLPYGAGIPQSTVDEVFAVHFNDADSMERRIVELDREGRKPACVIMEAAMMNLGVVLPEPGYLEAVRDITARHGVVLIFDEVKTGLCIAAGGATERWGVRADMVTLAKALGGGLPTGAIGGTPEVMSVVEDGSVFQVGTYNGNPLGMAAARANLLEVLTPDAYERLDALNDRLLHGCTGVVERYNLPGYAVGVGSKGCVTFSPVKIVDYETFKANQDAELADLAWLFNMNRGIYMTPGREEEWTLSVTHTDEAVDAYVAVFDEMARELTS
ncbi:MAG TPA: aspartate aminotransferase family protein [Solirubrobacteraceae bacterium]|jgi:glutamate-1-semialdehyde 2,1-aminomutase|nr:aspartate aminotransferase family protein [Solirubrobacteraceae bacterium]